MNLKDIKPLSLMTSAFLAGALVFTGCGGDSDSKKKTAVTNPYTGSATLTGTVSLNGLSQQDQALVSSSSASGSSVKRISATGDAVVKLYVLDEEGELEDTGVSCDINNDSTYSCAGIADGQEYIVRYVKELSNGKILELKSSASVASGATSAEAKVDPVTTMVTEAIMDAVIEAITGVVSDQDLVKKIIASVKTAVESTVKTLISTGAISVPSLVADGTIDDFVDTDAENEGLAEVSGAILTDNDVTSSLNAAKNEVQGDALVKLSDRDKIATIFDQMFGEGDGGAPGWMIDFLGDKYNAVEADMTVQWLTTMMLESMELRTEELYWILQLDQGSALPTWVTSMMSEIQSAITAGMQNADAGSALAEAISAIDEYHTIKAKDITTRTDAEKATMAEFPSIVGEIFTPAFIDKLQSTGMQTQFENVGQMVVYVVYLVDIYSREAASGIVETYFTNNDVQVFGDMKDKLYLVDFSPEGMFEELGFEQVAANYVGIYFDGWVDIRTDRQWFKVEGTTDQYEEKALLKIETGLENPAWFITCDAGLTADSITADLTYPTAAGTQTVAMDVMVESEAFTNEHCPNGGVEYRVRLLVGPNWENETCDDSGFNCQPEVNVAITDHVSGDYSITVSDGTYSATKTFEDIFVINDPDAYKPKLVSPKEYPQWPGDNATDAELEAFQTEYDAFWAEGGITTFAPGDNGYLEGALFKWKAPENIADLNLPDHVGVRYAININLFEPDTSGDGVVSDEERNACNMNWDQCNTEIYNTWWDGRAIKGTSFILPIELPENSAGGEYNIGVNLIFVDKDTGREVAVGGHAWANFKVGAVTALEDSTPINFTGSVTLEAGKKIPSWVDTSKLKVALVAEICEENTETGYWDCTADTIGVSGTVAVGSSYELNATVGDIKAQMANNKHISLVLFEDTVEPFNAWQTWSEGSTEDTAEDAFWMNGKWVWFENWGEFRVNVDTEGGDFTSQKVTNDGVTLTGMDFANPFIWEDYTVASADAETAE